MHAKGQMSRSALTRKMMWRNSPGFKSWFSIWVFVLKFWGQLHYDALRNLPCLLVKCYPAQSQGDPEPIPGILGMRWEHWALDGTPDDYRSPCSHVVLSFSKTKLEKLWSFSKTIFGRWKENGDMERRSETADIQQPQLRKPIYFFIH